MDANNIPLFLRLRRLVRQHWLGVVIIAIGFFLRFSNLEKVAGFDFDQETAAWWVKRFLVDHTPSLLGQEISIGGLYTGPGYYYLLSLFYKLLSMDPLSGNILQMCFAFGTMLVLYRAAGVVGLTLYSFSNAMIIIDQTYNPSTAIIFLASLSLLFYKSLPVQTILSAVGWNFHPVALLFAPIGLIATFISKTKVNFKRIIGAVILFLLLVSPYLLFEFRHGFLQTTSLLAGISGRPAAGEAYPIIFKMLLLSRNAVEAFLYILGITVTPVTILLSTMVIIFSRKITGWLLVFLSVPIVSLSFYPFHVPNYYLLTIYPALIILITRILEIPRSFPFGKVFVVGLLALFAFNNSLQALNNKNPFGLFYKRAAVHYILEKAKSPNPSYSVDADLGLNNGFKYLFWLYGAKGEVRNDLPAYTIYLPDTRTKKPGVIFGSIKVVKN